MAQMTDIVRKVKRLVERLVPAPICAACLAARLEGPSEQEVSLALNELAVEKGFSREPDDCSLCGKHGPVIHKHR